MGDKTDDDDQTDDDKKFEEQFDKLFTKKFNEVFHKAAGERDKRFEQKINKSIEGLLATKFGELTEMIKGSTGGAKEKEEPTGQQGTQPGTGDVKLPAHIEATMKQAQKDAQAAKETAEKYKREAEEERARSRKAEERQKLTELLTGHVKPAILEMVVSDLHGKHITRDSESGEILWKSGDEVLPFKDGVDGWKKSDLAKEVAPPRDVGGGGNSGPKNAPRRAVGQEPTMENLGDFLSGTLGRG